ncbi:helix-turn-helix domain-containing protein [Mesorhizobium australicum]|uniref:Helix-turn-helix domain-containing protein n=1 Tax=Mesorhizobium australicum TaxID=536018 RepID=A0A1X7MQ32_9HYPH|nr:helix-turn-helix domain-containing protein [Mesorhizobium australicum]SMH26057.1 hypothetical protein SAMN02982922_0005 [Mesorhizobium australicum]SMH26083.1 hypothetical protein SAMN02982922_0017 [Mesorhizobium australicum]
MFTAVGEILDQPLPAGVRRSRVKRTHQPVRRNSHRAGGQEGIFWRPIPKEDRHRIVAAARKFELVTRHERRATEPNTASGALGLIAVELLEYLVNLADRRSGRLEPSIDYLAAKLCHGRNTIIRALAALRRHGFLDWIRRYVPTGNEGRGPQVQQTSNAYRLFLPARAARLLGRYFHPAPTPADEQQRQQDRATEIETMRASMSEIERTIADVDPDSSLGAALIRMAEARARCAERESHKGAESLSRFNSMAK